MYWRLCHAALGGALVSVLVAACTSVDTSLAGPAAATKCQVSAASTPASFGPSGGAGTLNISTTRDCTWSITGIPAWISIAGEHGGQGEAAVAYGVAPNPVPAPRSGSIIVGTGTAQVNQDAAPCQFRLSRSEDAVAASGGRVSVDVNTLTGCNWSASNDVPWVAIASGRTGDASGTVGLDVAPNIGAARSGTLRIAGEAFTLRQAAAGTPFGPNPLPPPPPPPPPPPSGPGPLPPPTPTAVQFEGTTRNVSGRCPTLSFSVSGHNIETSGATSFTSMSCRDLEKKDRRVRVTGVERPNGTVDATRVTKIDGDDD